jgi:hypothetical protein
MHELSPGELQLENLLDAEATAGKKATVVSEPADSLRVIPTRRALRAASPPARSGECLLRAPWFAIPQSSEVPAARQTAQ